MTTPTIDFDGLRERALAAVVVNDTVMLSDGIEEYAGLAARQAEVRSALRSDTSRFLNAVTRILFPPRKGGSRRDRMIDAAGL